MSNQRLSQIRDCCPLISTHPLNHVSVSNPITSGVPKVTEHFKLQENYGSQNYENQYRCTSAPKLFIATSAFQLPHAITSLGLYAQPVVAEHVTKTAQIVARVDAV